MSTIFCLTLYDFRGIVYLQGGDYVKDRLKDLRKNLGMSQEAFAKELGLTKNYVSLVENGNRNLSTQSIKILCSLFNVNEEWLRTGNGEMFNPEIPNDEISNMLADVLKLENKDFRKRLLVALSKLDSDGWHELEKFIDSISNPSPPDEEE